MNQLPTWTLILLVPLAVALLERRKGRTRPRLEQLGLAGCLGLLLLATAMFPGEVRQAALIGAVVAAWGALALTVAAVVETLPSLVRRRGSAMRRVRGAPHPRVSPRPGATSRVA
jgi:hypothetical protein